jgi:hypothetical protein
VAINDPVLGNHNGNAHLESVSSNVKKIYNNMEVSFTDVAGGVYQGDTVKWLVTIPNAPAIADQRLERLDNLIIDSLDEEGQKAKVCGCD